MNAHTRTCKRLCEDAGLVVLDIKRGKHLKLRVRHNDRDRTIIFAASPSDGRWIRNQQAYINRIARES